MSAPASTASPAPRAGGSLALRGLASRQGLLLPILLVLFFGSGISGLVYEVVWLRYLSLVFGVTIYAVSTVLSAFMGGLALGGFLAGRVAGRLKRPLRAYGLAEIGIGLTALLTPPAFGALRATYTALYPSLPHDLTSLSLVRFVLACVILLVPTTLMGATLPIVVRSTLGRSASLGTNLSLLYASNTTGGIAGAYVAGFILIGTAGIRATTTYAAALNLAVGLGAILLDTWLTGRTADGAGAARDPRPLAGSDARPVVHAARESRVVPAGALRLLLVAFFVSGFASLGYQVIWTRILAIFFEATTYAFTLILCTFLLGIAAGSYLISPVINRRANWLFWAAVMEWGIGVTALISVAVISRIPAIVETLRYMPVLEHTVSGEQRLTALTCFITIIPTTLLLGAAFPVIMKLYASGGAEAGADAATHGTGDSPGVTRRLGHAYAANVCGSIGGSWASGFVLIPLLGTHSSLVLLACANIALGLGLLAYALKGRRLPTWRAPRVLVPAGVLLAIGAWALTPDMYAAVFSRFGDRVLWYEEGLEQTVTILQGPEVRRMYLNGWHQANDTPQMIELHTLIGHLPMLVQPPSAAARPERDVLVIGLGGGATAGAAASYRGAQLDVVELSPSVVKGATFFSHVNGGVVRLQNDHVVEAPNVHVDTDDGRNYLLLTDRRYDVIMADAIRPQHAGSAALYSAEYYALARHALKDDGVMVQWIDNTLPANQYAILLRTFLESFPYVTGWAGGSLFVGANQPYQLDRSVLDQRLASSTPEMRKAAGLSSDQVVLNLFTASDAELRAWTGSGPSVTDDHPYNEFFRSLPHQTDPADLSGFSHNAAGIVK